MLSGKVVTIIYLKEIIMKSNSLTLPINLEQIAILIKGMPPQQRKKLVAMVPELAIDALMQEESKDEVSQIIQELKEELIEIVGEKQLSKETFLGGFTLVEYLKLSEEERNNLWDQWSRLQITDLEEIKVHSDALPA